MTNFIKNLGFIGWVVLVIGYSTYDHLFYMGISGDTNQSIVSYCFLYTALIILLINAMLKSRYMAEVITYVGVIILLFIKTLTHVVCINCEYYEYRASVENKFMYYIQWVVLIIAVIVAIWRILGKRGKLISR